MKRSTNNKFEVKTSITDNAALIYLRALDKVTISEIVETIFRDAIDLKFKSFEADSAKKIVVKFVSVEGEVREFKRTRLWINETTVLHEIAAQFRV